MGFFSFYLYVSRTENNQGGFKKKYIKVLRSVLIFHGNDEIKTVTLSNLQNLLGR